MSDESLFIAALAKETPAEREAFLNEACGTDRALRARIQLLLEADARACGVLDQPTAPCPQATGLYSRGHEVGEIIAGRYKLLEAIGEGGMGTVTAIHSRPNGCDTRGNGSYEVEWNHSCRSARPSHPG